MSFGFNTPTATPLAQPVETYECVYAPMNVFLTAGTAGTDMCICPDMIYIQVGSMAIWTSTSVIISPNTPDLAAGLL